MESKVRGVGAVSFNMTPMIDIVFQLIIFFMVVSQFYQLSVKNVDLPPAVRADQKKKELQEFTQVVVNVVPIKGQPITEVYVDSELVVTVNYNPTDNKLPNWQALIDKLVDKRKSAEENKRKPVNVILRADEKVPYETIGSIMIATAKAGIRYWWVQAYKPGPGTMDFDRRVYLGVKGT